MREHKYRAQSLSGELIYFELHESQLSGDPDVFYVKGIPCKTGTEQDCCNLKDRKNQEIYEGDMIRKPDGRTCRVTWFSSPAFVGFDLNVVSGEGQSPSRYSMWGEEWEVIGNIYDPELLK